MLSTTALNVLITNKILGLASYDDVTRQLRRFRRIVFARLAPLDLRTFGNLRIDQTIKRDGRRAARFSGSVTFVAAQGKVMAPQLALSAQHLKGLYEGCKTLLILKSCILLHYKFIKNG